MIKGAGYPVKAHSTTKALDASGGSVLQAEKLIARLNQSSLALKHPSGTIPSMS